MPWLILRENRVLPWLLQHLVSLLQLRPVLVQNLKQLVNNLPVLKEQLLEGLKQNIRRLIIRKNIISLVKLKKLKKEDAVIIYYLFILEDHIVAHTKI